MFGNINHSARWIRGLGAFLVLLVLTAIPAVGQQDPRAKLKQLRDERGRFRRILEQEKERELSTLDLLEGLDGEINLFHRIIGELQREETALRRAIGKSDKEIEALQEKFDIEKAIYGKRVVYLYKHRNQGNLETFLKSKSFNQVLVWLKYNKKISDADARRLRNLRETKAGIEASAVEKKSKLADLETTLGEKTREETQLKKKKVDREKILIKIRQDTRLYAQKIEEINRASLEIQRLLRESTSGNAPAPIAVPTGPSFTTAKGRMPWPVQGSIIKRFGRHKNPAGKNVYYPYDGIDIRAGIGDPVQATYDGVVSMITFMRALGNIVMIRHAGNYHTAYTHLSEILVNIGQEVATGDIIGRVGESGSISGPILHFQIYDENYDPVNPEEWLQKSVPLVAR